VRQSEVQSETNESPGESLSLRSGSSTDVDQASGAADESNVRRSENRHPLGLDFESEMTSWIEADSSPEAERESREADRGTGREMRPTNTAQHIWFGPARPFFDERLVAEVAMELIQNDALLRRSGGDVLGMYVGILARPAELDEVLLTIGQQAEAEREAEAGTGIEDHARVRPGNVRLDGETHAGAVSSERSEIEAKRFGRGFLAPQRR